MGTELMVSKAAQAPGGAGRSEERRGGEKGRSRWAPDHLKKKIKLKVVIIFVRKKELYTCILISVHQRKLIVMATSFQMLSFIVSCLIALWPFNNRFIICTLH